jgi:hypothetical protein
MPALCLYCKSFSTDLKRVVRLADSVSRFNADHLPFVVSIPRVVLPLFREHLSGSDVTLIADEEIVRANRRLDAERVANLPGSISQQIVKSEFWRLGLSDAYLCLDSDSIFIRPFRMDEYLASDGTPYTVMTEAHELLFDALSRGKAAVIENFHREARTLQDIFRRVGRPYSFGPMPMVWHRAVWESLESRYLRPQSMTFADAIELAPLESRWYGEALLRYRAVELRPCEPFFKVYHYAWQFSGVIYQSSWERNLDWPREGGSPLSLLARRIRRKLGRV